MGRNVVRSCLRGSLLKGEKLLKHCDSVRVAGALGLFASIASAGCSTTVAPTDGGIDASSDAQVAGDAPIAVDAPVTGDAGGASALLLGMTLHLENKTFDKTYFTSLDTFAKTFESHGGRLTFEPRDSCVSAAAGPPALFDWKALEARGHSVGSHAAIGGVDVTTVQQFTAQAKMRYEQLSPSVNRLDHISGNCGNVDWVKGVTEAGFTATTAATVLCFYGMPADSRPAEYKNLSCKGSTDPVCHTSYPIELAQRLHPWRVASSATWLTDDKNGKLVIIPGSGTLPCLEEEATNPGTTLPTCSLTKEDVTRAMAELDAAIALRDPNKLNTFYWVWGSWSISSQEQAILDSFLSEVDKRVAKGQIKWSSIGSMLDAYAEWEKTHR